MKKEDYGQTLAVHGTGPGCYLVLPVLVPATARDTASSLINVIGGDAWYNITVKNNTSHFRGCRLYCIKTAGVDFRAKNYDSFDNLEKNSIDFFMHQLKVYIYKIDNKKY